eukprot:TRINITY_DN396_c1_g1_i5.p2 TRINITY_DN396_c1_g1~~TRINITY_DN396_c1_g1_i5.p2  ORF type:complete len:231 (-),score=-4.18 TRINITY_DN396_c1_g1_i5:252-944(-)
MSSLMSMQGYMRNLAVWMMCFNDLLPNIMLLVKAKSKMQTSLLLQQTVLLMRIQRIRGKSQYGGLVFSLDQVCVYRFEINNGRTQTINETSFRSANQCSIYPQTSTSQLNYYQIAKHQVSYPHKRQNGQNLTCMVEIANLILCWIETIRRDHIRNIKVILDINILSYYQNIFVIFAEFLVHIAATNNTLKILEFLYPMEQKSGIQRGGQQQADVFHDQNIRTSALRGHNQ